MAVSHRQGIVMCLSIETLLLRFSSFWTDKKIEALCLHFFLFAIFSTQHHEKETCCYFEMGTCYVLSFFHTRRPWICSTWRSWVYCRHWSEASCVPPSSWMPIRFSIIYSYWWVFSTFRLGQEIPANVGTFRDGGKQFTNNMNVIAD